MFAIAAVIWIFILFLFIKNSQKKKSGFFVKHTSTLIAFIIALILTVTDIWLFVSYIPTHFKKAPVELPAISAKELLNDTSLTDSILKPIVDAAKKDSTNQTKSTNTISPEKILVTNKASIRFFSSGSAEDIEATNSSVAASFNETTGQLKFSGLIRGFIFDNEMMQEHFNDKDYMNSEAFPKTSFKGNVLNIKTVNFSKDGNYPVNVEGSLSIHGVSKSIKAIGTAIITVNSISLKSVFKIKRVDFGINTDEIADELEITVITEFK